MQRRSVAVPLGKHFPCRAVEIPRPNDCICSQISNYHQQTQLSLAFKPLQVDTRVLPVTDARERWNYQSQLGWYFLFCVDFYY